MLRRGLDGCCWQCVYAHMGRLCRFVARPPSGGLTMAVCFGVPSGGEGTLVCSQLTFRRRSYVDL